VENIHKKYLFRAHLLAKRNFGRTFPNPSVGCLIVKNNKIISKGITASAGRPHAEEIALKNAGKNSKGSTMYVTLEPCNHKSYNASCTNQIIRSGIRKIFIAAIDPDPRTNSKSIKKLIQNNIDTYYNITSDKTYSLNKFFFISQKNNRPFIKVKMAISNDEKIAKHNYKSKWISNSESRKFAHKLRNFSQAILTTSKTIIKDNPRFTVRKNNKVIRHMPVIVIDNYLKTPINSRVLKYISRRRVIIFTSTKNQKYEILKRLGCEIILMKKDKNLQLSLKRIFKKILFLGIKDILVESGGIFLTNLLKNNLVDEMHIFKSKKVIGNKGIPLIIGKSINDIYFVNINKKKFGNDEYSNYVINS
tara:strand:- start:730 stop:1815 length:1086 start_codon:yes stop_codon:yes gene_type:complete